MTTIFLILQGIHHEATKLRFKNFSNLFWGTSKLCNINENDEGIFLYYTVNGENLKQSVRRKQNSNKYENKTHKNKTTTTTWIEKQNKDP